MKLQEQYGGADFRVVGLNSMTAVEAQGFAERMGVNYPLYANAWPIFEEFGIRFIPQVFLVGPDGTVEADGLAAARRALAAG